MEATYLNLTVAPTEIAQTATNYNVPVLGILKYTNDDGVGNGQTFTLDHEWFTWPPPPRQWPYHYFFTAQLDGVVIGAELFTIVKAGAADLPKPCYKVFFYNGCYTGRDYIGNFQHGIFFYTTGYGGDSDTTKTFIKSVINGESWNQIKSDINSDAGTPGYFNYHQQSSQ